MSTSSQRLISVEITYDEAVVLFEWLHRLADQGLEGGTHPGERVAIANLTATFEPLIDEVFSPDFDQVVQSARQRLAGGS